VRPWLRTTLVIFALTVLVAGVVAVGISTVLRARTERELGRALDDLGAPAGFRPTGESSTGSIFCFGPCLRRHARYVGDMPFADAVAQVTAHLQSKGATKSCTLNTDCGRPLAPEDCRVVNNGPECLIAAVVDGRPVFIRLSRGAPPIALQLTGAPKKDLNLFF
jgi:hypothetical protein